MTEEEQQLSYNGMDQDMKRLLEMEGAGLR